MIKTNLLKRRLIVLQIHQSKLQLEIEQFRFFDFCTFIFLYYFKRECQQKGVANERSVKGYINTQMFRHRLKKRNVAFGQFNCFLMDQVFFNCKE
jgi:hypothetical protein